MLRRWFAPLGASALLAVVLAPAVRADDSDKKKDDTKAAKPTVAVFTLSGELNEKPKSEDVLFGALKATNLKDLVARLEKAAGDPQVKAVVVLLEDAQVGTAQKEEVRKAIKKVREAGKDVYAHADSLQMGGYALLCGASRLSIVPTGDLWVNGIFAEAPYLR